ncbi:hypothetical protein ABFP60_04070 [Clostridioides difficile]
MKKLLHLIIPLTLVILLFSTPSSFPLCSPINNIFEEGVYKVKSENGDITPGEYSFKLISNDSICYIYIIDRNDIQRYSKRFDSRTLNDSSLSNSGRLLEGDTIIIFGTGEFYFNSLK